MRALVQRVSKARVITGGEIVGEINRGLLVLLGVSRRDVASDADYLLGKVVNLRIFDNEKGQMDRSLLDIEGELLIVSQFTLYGDTRKGRRPSYDEAAPAETARNLYNYFVEQARALMKPKVATGVFQAEMLVESTNDGPVTLMCESKL